MRNVKKEEDTSYELSKQDRVMGSIEREVYCHHQEIGRVSIIQISIVMA